MGAPLTVFALGSATTTISSPSCCSIVNSTSPAVTGLPDSGSPVVQVTTCRGSTATHIRQKMLR